MPVTYKALSSKVVRDFRHGKPDANGMVAERQPASPDGAPCRHCLQDIPEGEELLIIGYRPFDQLQPYAEVVPIFLCAQDCERHPDTSLTPELFLKRDRLLLKGYDENHRIKYPTCRIVPSDELTEACEKILSEIDVAYVHIRSASANCYQCRVERPG